MKEGDTPSWFFFLPNGLGDPAHPEWGGWGGRFQKDDRGIWRDAPDTLAGKTDARLTVSRWRPAFQNEFAARLDWCVKPRTEANHPPIAVCNGEAGEFVVRLRAAPGERVLLSAKGSSDPDGQTLVAHWLVYPEAGTYRGVISLSDARGETTGFVTPQVEQTETIHVILQVQDSGRPPLSAYRRAVVTVHESSNRELRGQPSKYKSRWLTSRKMSEVSPRLSRRDRRSDRPGSRPPPRWHP